MNILSEFNRTNKSLREGEVFTLNEFCKNKFSEKCKKYYDSISNEGIHECPYGFFSVATNHSLNNSTIYTSLIVNELISKKIKNKGFIKNKFSKDEINRLIGIFEQKDKIILKDKEEEKDEITIIHSIFHEIRRLSRDLDGAGTILQKIDQVDDYTTNLVNNVLQTIKLISIRIDSYELLKNPMTITSGKQPNIQVYKKFDKCRYILNSKAKAKNTKIHFDNESYFTINGYDIFDLIPYIILDNAVKYSPTLEPINVCFNNSKKCVTVSSIGPKLDESEKSKLFTKGFRGKNSLGIQGSGLGLNMLKQICDLHKIDIEIKSDTNVTRLVDNIPYSCFETKLFF